MQNKDEKPNVPPLKPESEVFKPIDRLKLTPGLIKAQIEHYFEHIWDYQSGKGRHAKKQLRMWCQLHAVFCLRIDVDPYERIAQHLDRGGSHVSDDARSRILLLKSLVAD